MTKTYIMNSLMEKMESPDQDHRYMGLTDLISEINLDHHNFYGDETTEIKVLNHVLKLVGDKISEVKNQAVKALGVLIKIVRESQMELIVDQLIEFSGSQEDDVRDIASLALKTVSSSIPTDSKLAPNACAKLTPKLLHQCQVGTTPPETLIETLSILSILIMRFPGYLSSPDMQPQAVPVLVPLLSHQRTAVRKRAIQTLAQALPISPQSLYAALLTQTILPGLAGGANRDTKKTTVQLVAAIARHCPQKLTSNISDIVSGTLGALNNDDEELREYALQTLEALLLRCPTDVTPYTTQIIQAGCKYIAYDPNYTGDDEDEDEEMADPDDDDDEVDEYSDDEDTSYKVRRSATKLLSVVIETRPELLATCYKDISPVLIKRFGDREQNVKLEVWATYGLLLKQTKLYGGVPQASSADSPGVTGKRKRSNAGMDVEDAPYHLLRNQLPSLSAALFKQLKSPKTPANVLQAGFQLLRSVLDVVPGSLAASTPQITSTAKIVLSQSASSSNAPLFTTCLSFLSSFFSTHSPPTFTSSTTVLVPVLLKCLRERHPRVVSETFRVFSSLLNALKPVKAADWVDAVYDESVTKLRSADTDADVRERAEVCMGDLWICATDAVRPKGGKEWDAMCRTSGRMDGAVKVVAKVVQEVDVGDAWISGSIEWILGVMRKSGKTEKLDAFTCLEALLRKYKGELPSDLLKRIVDQMRPYISTSEIQYLGQALSVLALLLSKSPRDTYIEVESKDLPTIYKITHSPSVSGAALDAVLEFFAALVTADNEIANHVIPNLVQSREKASKEASNINVARCVGQIVKSQMSIAAGVISEFSKSVKSSKAKAGQIVLSLLILGELGRNIDFAPQKELFQIAIDHFSNSDEDIRSAAAFCAGNMAIGNLQLFLPAIVKLVQTDSEKRLLALHAIKEVVSNCRAGPLENVSETIWVPLFQDSANSEESTRNVAAACLGKLTTTNPGKYLPQLQQRIRDPVPATRATVIAAIRYTFADTSRAYDELLALLVTDFLSAMVDADLTVRRLALSALNAAARNKPHLIREHLPTLLPNLYKETVINQSLIRTVQMGPWSHKVDDGLEARKTAYETMYTLLDSCLSRLDLHEFLNRVIAGLKDDSNEIKVLAHMMLSRLSQIAPVSVIQRLDDISAELEGTVKGPDVTKDTVKQDLERAAELRRSALRAVAALARVNTPGVSQRFDAFLEMLQRSDHANELALAEGRHV